MRVLGLDGREYPWAYTQTNNQYREHSSFHDKARPVIKSLFPSERIWEEVALPGTRPTLYADYVIPLRKIMIEIHGQQHYEFVPYFHTDKKGFADAKRRDQDKKRWCNLNGFLLIELDYREDEHEWKQRISNFGQQPPSKEEGSDIAV